MLVDTLEIGMALAARPPGHDIAAPQAEVRAND